MTSKRTLVVEEIKNLTDKKMWLYGTSGELLLIEPSTLAKQWFGPLPEPRHGVYYVVEGDLKEEMEYDWRYRDKVAVAKFIGTGKDGEEIYSFSNIDGVTIIPVSDKYGTVGRVVERKGGRSIYV